MNDLTRIALEAQNAVRLDRETERKRPFHVVLAVAALALAVFASDRDYQEAVIHEAIQQEVITERVIRSEPAFCQRCPKSNIDGDWLSLEAIHRADGGECFIHCKYDEERL